MAIALSLGMFKLFCITPILGRQVETKTLEGLSKVEALTKFNELAQNRRAVVSLFDAKNNMVKISVLGKAA